MEHFKKIKYIFYNTIIIISLAPNIKSNIKCIKYKLKVEIT